MEYARKRKIRQHPGDAFAIDLGDGFYAFGQVCGTGDYAFFDLRSATLVPPEQAAASSVVFRVICSDQAIKAGDWPILGNVPLPPERAAPAAYRQQPVGSNQLYIYQNDTFRPADIEEVRDLEVLAGWSVDLITERLRDHFAGIPNDVVESLKRIRVYDGFGNEMRATDDHL
jgi:hypothetical protein